MNGKCTGRVIQTRGSTRAHGKHADKDTGSQRCSYLNSNFVCVWKHTPRLQSVRFLLKLAAMFLNFCFSMSHREMNFSREGIIFPCFQPYPCPPFFFQIQLFPHIVHPSRSLSHLSSSTTHRDVLDHFQKVIDSSTHHNSLDHIRPPITTL